MCLILLEVFFTVIFGLGVFNLIRIKKYPECPFKTFVYIISLRNSIERRL